MENYEGCIDAAWLLDSLLKVLPIVLKSVMRHRHQHKQAKFLGRLFADLHLLRERNEALPLKAVMELKLMCTWTKHPINTLDRATKITDALAADGVTNSDSEAVRMVSESLRAFAMATPQEQGSYKQLSEVRERARREISELSQTNSMAGRKMHKSTPEDYPEFVNVELYDTLRGYTRCQCQLSGEAAAIEHEAKLCLRSQVHINQDLVDFDLHFWSSPHWERTNQNCHWQQLRMHVPSKKARLKKTRFQDIASGSTTPLHMLPATSMTQGNHSALQMDEFYVPSHEFCALLSESIGPAKICLRLQESSFLRIHGAIDTDQELANKPSVSLAQVLRHRSLTTKMKISLAYTLARSVWQYYNSDWMGSGWTSNTIHFMLETFSTSNHSYIDVSKPCFTVQFQTATGIIPEYDGSKGVVHPHPRVVALGMLLVHVANTSYDEDTAAVLETHACEANKRYAKGRRALRDQNWPDFGIADAARQRLRTDYKTATESCFDRMIFRDIQSSQSGADQVEEHRRILYERVVCPLEEIIGDMGWMHSLDKIDVIKFGKMTNRDEESYHQPKSALLSYNISRAAVLENGSVIESVQQPRHRISPPCSNAAFFDDDLPPDGHTSKLCQAYQDWKTDFTQVYEHFINEDQSKSVSPVKIAILDTGLDVDHECIEAHAETLPKRVLGKNWLEEKTSKHLFDSNGHGTHIAGIILDLVPHAELLVAKVTDGVVLDPRTLAQAIDHAVDQHVDIITISMGFPQKVSGYDELEFAIKRAHLADVLIFAAASNGGGNKDRAYPARDKHVFCIHATDAWGNRSRFSPTAERNTYNFATVGEAVESFWPKHLCNPDEAAVRTKSGTSFATPIAASVAAFLLLYARVNLVDEPEISQRLKGFQAMELLLYEVCQSSRAKTDRDGYQYIFLSQYPGTFFGRDRDREEINNRFRRCT